MTDQVYYQAKEFKGLFQFESFVNQTSAQDVSTCELDSKDSIKNNLIKSRQSDLQIN